MANLANYLAQHVVSMTRRSVLVVFATGFAVVYLPLTVSTFFLDYYPHVVDTLAVLFFLMLAAMFSAWTAWIKLPGYELTEPERTRENRGWLLIAAGSALILIARLIYAVNELVAGEPGGSIALADGLFAVSFIFFVAGLLMFPCSSGEVRTGDVVLDAGTVLMVVATILWPMLIGPVMANEFGGAASFWTIASYLFGIVVMTGSALWVLMRGVRHEVLAAAVCLAASVGTMVLIQVGYLAFMSSPDSTEMRLLFVNGMTSLAFLLVGLASILRLQVTGTQREDEYAELASFDRPVHRRQIILPFPLIGILLLLLLVMEVSGWRAGYTEPMVIGSVAVVTLLMYRQLQLLRFNDRLYERVAGAAIRDGLTGLYNHRTMHEILGTQAAQIDRSGHSLAVIFLDIDRFKDYNDTYGHRQGDGLLTSIAELLLEECRDSDYVGRYGGEEFMVIAPDARAEDACRLGERLRAAIGGTHYVHNGTRSAVTVSVGVAVYPDDGDPVEDVVDRADQAMYQAKTAGRNQTVLYHPA